MEFNEVISDMLPVVYVVLGAFLIWLTVELIMTARKTRKVADDLQKQVEPTLGSLERISASLEPSVANIERMTASLEPAIEKVEPLVDRVSLTVDAANLEIMRIDQILEDMTDITDTVSSTVEAVDTVASAPLGVVTSVMNRIQGSVSPRRASEESIALGQAKAQQVHQEEGAVSELPGN